MNKTYNFYCDESTHLQNDGKPYMIIAYVSSSYHQLKSHKDIIKSLKEKHKVSREIKWSSVSKSKYPFYSDLIDYFFLNDLKFRAIIVDKSQIDENRPGFTYNEFYFKMYYQLIHNKLDFECNYNVYFDIKDTCSQAKLRKLKDILKLNTSLRSFQFIRSHESHLMQLTDLIMGAINYKLRNETKVTAKTKLIEKIESHSKILINKPTPKNEDKLNLFFINLK